jgi:hypothetical protein
VVFPRPATAATVAKSGIARSRNPSYTRIPPGPQHDFTTAFDSLRTGHYRFVRSAVCWFRWSKTDGWRPVSFVEVYDHLVSVDVNRYPPRWLLRHIEGEARRNPEISADGYWGLHNSPVISHPTFTHKTHIARGHYHD